jgi:hyperosmotically inducible periplasmic protein
MRKLILGGVVFVSLLLAQGNSKDDQIYDQVRLKLAGSPDVNGGGIEVVVKDGAVILKGKVLKQKQKDKATTVAKKVKGVKTVDNQLTVELAEK